MRKSSTNKINFWKTENLEGNLRVWKDDCSAPAVSSSHFKMPTNNAVGHKAKQHILEAAGCVGLEYGISFRCVKHYITCSITSQVIWREFFSFRRTDLPDVRYDIELEEDEDTRTGVGFEGAFKDDFSKNIKTIKDKKIDDVSFRFCSEVGSLLHEIRKKTELHFLSLLDTYDDTSVFQEIGHLRQLRGLYLYGWSMIKLDQAAVGELQKLKKLETLSIFNDFPVSVDALPELSKLKSLKALKLDLQNVNLGNNHKARVERLSFLRKLENLEVLELGLCPRLSPRELALPPNLKYLKIRYIGMDHVYRSNIWTHSRLEDVVHVHDYK